MSFACPNRPFTLELYFTRIREWFYADSDKISFSRWYFYVALKTVIWWQISEPQDKRVNKSELTIHTGSTHLSKCKTAVPKWNISEVEILLEVQVYSYIPR